ncbi:CBU_0592 family membrane protein [Flexithrix dorotheae]|uniref:CBU_0592 family membrane protein n=1 Tax=Flexithrix dorotheae TaxID=70993 RepID=UPI00039EACC1|nr:hypothetical protein [Flexithrix dorotheae]
MIFEIIGWIGTIVYILSYFLLSINKLKSQSITYQAMNVIGGLCLVINAIHLSDGPTFFLNFIWMLIGLFAVLNVIRNRRRVSNF